jgi:hypothetical protein
MNSNFDDDRSRAPRALFAVLTVLSVSPAQAYVDPGTGSMLLQMGLAAVAGALFYFRQFRMAIAHWFRCTILRKDARPAESSPSATDVAP